MPNPIPDSGTRISYVGRLGVGAHPEATKYVGTVLPGDTGVVGPPCTAPRLKGWVCTYPDTVRYHGAGVDPADVEPTAPEAAASVVCHPSHFELLEP